jgi:hypothetical protein
MKCRAAFGHYAFRHMRLVQGEKPEATARLRRPPYSRGDLLDGPGRGSGESLGCAVNLHAGVTARVLRLPRSLHCPTLTHALAPLRAVVVRALIPTSHSFPAADPITPDVVTTVFCASSLRSLSKGHRCHQRQHRNNNNNLHGCSPWSGYQAGRGLSFYSAPLYPIQECEAPAPGA